MKKYLIRIKNNSGELFEIIFLAILFINIAFINGYPVYYLGDSAAYISMAYNFDHGLGVYSIFYSLFLKITSLNYTLWGTIYFQAIILIFCLREAFNILSKGLINENRSIFLLVIIVLSFFTSVSKPVSRLLPDAFTSCLLLSFFVLIIKKPAFNFKYVIICLFFVISILIHSSHLLIMVGVIFAFLVYYILFFNQKDLVNRSSLIIISLLVIVSPLIQTFTHKTLFGSYYFSKGQHVYLMDKLTEFGILQEYLRDNCKDQYKICAHKENLNYIANGEFMWNTTSSPLYIVYGNNYVKAWSDSKEEYSQIIREIMVQPHFLTKFILRSAISSSRQLFNFYHLEETSTSPWLDNTIKQYFPSDFPLHIKSLQYTSQLSNQYLSYFNYLTRSFLLISSIYLLMYFVKSKLTTEFKVFIIVLFSFIFINSVVCGTLSIVQGRYQERLIWLIPFIALSLFLLKPERFDKK
jgi:hypothetical protein